MLFIFPQLTDFEREWKIIKQRNSYYYHNTDVQIFFRDFLYCLLHDVKGFVEAQSKFIQRNEIPGMAEIAGIFDMPAYDELLKKINFQFVKVLFINKTNKHILNLKPLTEIVLFAEKIKGLVKPEEKNQLPFDEISLDFYKGNFNALKNSNVVEVSLYNSAIGNLTQGNIKAAISDFDKALKIERADYKNLQLPPNIFQCFYFLTTVLCLESEETSLRAQKILKALDKNSYSTFDFYFKAVINNTLNNSSSKKSTTDTMFAYIKQEHNDLQSVLYICICFLAEAKPHVSVQQAMETVVSKAYKAGNLILAYEAAFAMKVWYGSASCEKLYNDIAAEMNYKPVLSLISRQEEWEKSLNLLLTVGIDKAKSGGKEKDGESKNRVVYYFTPKTNEIQPILQTRTAKNGWSGGRNIALKTFFGGNVAGMTDQDFRVAKSMKHYSSYYDGDYYDFTEKSLKELIGHPYIFLNGTNDVPVELIAAQPEIKIVNLLADIH
jgi:hypothetical protein